MEDTCSAAFKEMVLAPQQKEDCERTSQVIIRENRTGSLPLMIDLEVNDKTEREGRKGKLDKMLGFGPQMEARLFKRVPGI